MTSNLFNSGKPMFFICDKKGRWWKPTESGKYVQLGGLYQSRADIRKEKIKNIYATRN